MDPSLQVSRNADRALEEFSDEMRGALALGNFDAWGTMFGLVRTTDAMKTTFPLPISAPGFREFKGDSKYRRLYHVSLSMKTLKWQDGVEAIVDVIEAPDFIDWAGEPSRIAVEWQRQPNTLVVEKVLESSVNIDLYADPDTNTASTRALFASDHPFNVYNPGLGTFDNDLADTVADVSSGAFFNTMNQHFRSIKGPNGKPLGLRLAGGTVIVPPARENLFKEALEQDTLIRAINNDATISPPAAAGTVVNGVLQKNLWQNTVSYIVADELTSDDVVYVLAGGVPQLYPWVVQLSGAPEEFVYDKSSEYYGDTGKVKINYIGKMNAAAAMPHGIAKVTLS